jgi:hypothetical protein
MAENDISVTVGADNAISVTVGTGQAVNVTATQVGPPGTGHGILLRDYGVAGQLPDWGGIVSVNLDNGNVVQPTLTGNVTGITVTGWPPSGAEGKLVLYIGQGAVPYSVTGWPVAVKWLGGLEPVLGSIDGQVDVIVLTSIDAGATIYGFHIGIAA